MKFTELFVKLLKKEFFEQDFDRIALLHEQPERLEHSLSEYQFRSRTVRALVKASQIRNWNGIHSHIETTTEEARKIVQYWDDETPPQEIVSLQETWQRMNSIFPHCVFNKDTARSFIGEYYTEREVEAFEYCHHPVLRSDIFRLLYLHRKGGGYVDSDEECLKSVELFLARSGRICLSPRAWHLVNNKELLVSRALSDDLPLSQCGFYINNAPLISSGPHPILAYAIEHAISKILESKAHRTFYRINELTSPAVFNKCLVRFIYSKGFDQGHVDDILLINDWYGHYSRERWLSYKNTSANWRRH